MLLRLVLTVLLLAPLTALQAEESPGLTLKAERESVELATERQKLVFTRKGEAYVMSTWVRDGQEWRAMFDAGRPLLEGSLFGWQPTRYTVSTNVPGRKSIEFSGHHRQPDYDWTLRVEATAASPLIRFTINCQLSEPLTLPAPQPVVALWMRRAKPAFNLDQGPDSIYGNAGIPHGYGFPAAYLWDEGREAAVFFNMTPMHWMQRDGVARFHDVRIMSRSESGQTGLGMHFKKLSGRRVPAGRMTIEFLLHQAMRPGKPSGLAALDTMVRAFAPLHPAESEIPRNQLTGEPARWGQFAAQTMAHLATPTTMAELPAPWRDEPLELVPPQEKMLVHPSVQSWDFSTVNNHLTPWLLLARLHGNAEALRLAVQKRDALPRFYDPRARLIRHGTRQPAHVGDLEMAWQNLCFHLETLRASAAAPPERFNPAVVGRFLMATAGLRELAREVDYVFPQWFDPYLKRPVVQNDVKQLGKVCEPWQAGAYAHVMLQAFQITGDKAFLTDAQHAIEALMERMQFRVQNEVYDRHYADPVEFPVTELFGNAHGIAAAHQLYEATGDAKFLRYSRDFLNTLLRLTFWHEDETSPASRELRNAGLFYPHGGAHVATPWETAEAHLLIAWTLKHDREHPLTELLLKLSNLNRINSFYFFPAAWSEPVRALDAKPRPAVGQYFPIEPFECLEGEGHRGPTAAYMSGLALWNDWLYEALAEASDREILVLNLDALEGYENAVAGVERHFLAYNPTPTNRTCRVLFKHLLDTDFLATVGTREEQLPAAKLRQGLWLTLQPGEAIRLALRRSDCRERQLQLQQQRAAQNSLSHAYQLLQERAANRGRTTVSPQAIQTFAEALGAYRSGRHLDADAKATQIIHDHRGQIDIKARTSQTERRP